MVYLIIGIVGAYAWIYYEAKTSSKFDEDINKFYKKRKK